MIIYNLTFINYLLYLYNADDEKDQEENSSLGVYWLIKASSQGHKEATELLRQCLETGKGLFVYLNTFIFNYKVKSKNFFLLLLIIKNCYINLVYFHIIYFLKTNKYNN